ncbi:MAG: PQQ-binding-like beta-propeller repeat protein [Thermoanaerobaculia bacterium]|nr:PQQ-binding-like beta-propeller repeat protein [Thermoanaerobaculia bacterium]
MSHRRGSIPAIALLAVLAAGADAGDDWPQWRGPERDGSLSSPELAEAEWPAELPRLWRVEVGAGHSSPVVAEGRVFVHSREGDHEVVTALSLANGERLWSDRYPAPFDANRYAGGHGKGPYATPLVVDGRLFTLGVNATLSAWNAATGELVWRLDPTGGAVDSSKLFCGTAGSPILVGDLLVTHVGDDRGGEVLAVGTDTGEVRWRWRGDGPGYASPVLAELDGTAQIVTLTDRSVISLDPQDGGLLWRIDFPDEWNENVVTPLVLGDTLLYSGVRAGTFLVRPRPTAEGFAVETVWRREDPAMYLSSPVEIGGRVFGMAKKLKGHLFRLDPASGEVTWRGEGRLGDNASLLLAGSTLLVTTTAGEMLVYDTAAEEPMLRASYELADSAVWAHPAVAGGVLLLRDAGGLSAWRLPSAPADPAAGP